jgi:rfaE bifunctional protein kinase chain/domain
VREAAAGELRERLLRTIDAFAGRRVLVLADLVADEFIYGRVQRISREAPVLILEYDRAEARLGGGANAVHNLRTLGGVPLPLGVLGADAHGRGLRELLRHAGVSARGVLTDARYATPVKSRILAGGVHSTKQQIVRIDKATVLEASSAVHARVRRALDTWRGRLDAVLVSDYGFGLLRPELVEAAVAFARARAVPITVDSRHALLRCRGMTAVTPNEPEVEAALGVTIGHDRARLEAAGRALLRRLRARAVLVTRGSDGMALFEPGRAPRHIPIHGGDQVADVTGAGDTVIATFTLALAAGAAPHEAALLANYAGGLVVMKLGTATVSADELRAAVGESAGPGPGSAGSRGPGGGSPPLEGDAAIHSRPGSAGSRGPGGGSPPLEGDAAIHSRHRV